MRSIDGLVSKSDKVAMMSAYKVVPEKANVVKITTPTEKKMVKKTKHPQSEPVKAKKKVSNRPSEKMTTEAKVPKKVARARDEFVAPVKSFDLELTSEELELDKVEEEMRAEDEKAKKKAKGEKGAKKEKKKVSKVRLVITSILLVIVLGAIGVVVWGMYWGNDIIAKLTGGESGIFDAINMLTSEKFVALKTGSNGRINILVFGTSGYDMEGNEGNGVHDGAALTDSIMVISVDPDTNDVAMVSLPRDLKAGRTCTSTGKVNEVYWCANMYGENEAAGASALQEKIIEILGVDTQYYVHVDWAALTTIVDALGGIDVVLDEDIGDIYYTGAVFEAGVEYHLDGGQALGLARARHGTALGDFSRGNSQQKILVAIKDKLMENGIGWMKGLEMINALGDNLRTNVSIEEMKSALWMLGDIDLKNMRQVPLIDYEQGVNYMTTGMVNGISYVLPTAGVDNYGPLQEYIKEQFTTPVVEESEVTEMEAEGVGEEQ